MKLLKEARPPRGRRRALTRSALTDEDWERWHDEGARVVSVLLDGLEADAATRSMPVLAAPVASIAGDRRPSVFCWPDDEWEALAEEYRLLVRDEFWLAGLADLCAPAYTSRPGCAPRCGASSRRRTRRSGTSRASSSPRRSSCWPTRPSTCARPTPRKPRSSASRFSVCERWSLEARRSPTYAEEMAGLAWDAGYPLQYEEYRTEKCADGGPLDLHPASDTWP